MNETPKNINHLTTWSTISFIVVFRCAIPFAFANRPIPQSSGHDEYNGRRRGQEEGLVKTR